MAWNTYKWTCKWYHQGEGCIDIDPVRYRVVCLLCLRGENYEACCDRNVHVEVINPQYAKESYVFRVSKFMPLGKMLLIGAIT